MADDRAATNAGGTRDDFKRICDLECALTKSRDALRVIVRMLEDMAERHATQDARELSEDDVSALYGTITLLNYTAGECERAYWGGAER